MERGKLIEELRQLELNLETPSQLRRIGEIKSLLLTDGERNDLRLIETAKCDSFFVKKSMTGVSNGRKRK